MPPQGKSTLGDTITAEMENTECICVVKGVLFSFSETAKTYDEFGSVSCAILGSREGDESFLKLGCYHDNKYICTANITSNNDVGAQISRSGCYTTFRDESSHVWSIKLESEDAAIEFCGSVAVAMYSAAGEPKDSMLAYDVSAGKHSKQVFANDVVKVAYRAWVVQRNAREGNFLRLGSLLEGTQDSAIKLMVPLNHQSVTSTMKGFEGMIIGMCEGGQRIVIIPVGVKRGGGPTVSMCFYIEVKKRKERVAVDRVPLQIEPPQASMPMRNGDSVTPVVGSAAFQLTPSSLAPLPVVSSQLSQEQFQLVDRLRDQVFTLSEQLRDTRRQLDTMSADFKNYERQSRPLELTSTQIKYSVDKLLTQSGEKKAQVLDKKAVIGELEARNGELEKRLEKFRQTAKILLDEKKTTADVAVEEKIDLDRQLADTNAKVQRLTSEVEDGNRHLLALKNILHAKDVELRTEKINLTGALSEFQVDEEKLQTLLENYAEESAKRKILESKLLSLSDEVRCIQNDVQIKENLTQQCEQKMESNALHYSQLLDQEREQAKIELRQLRQDLIEELATREREYNEEKERVGVEAYTSGRRQGVEDGMAEATHEGDMAVRDMAVGVQRAKAEVAALRTRLQASDNANAADQRYQDTQVGALQGLLAEILQENNKMSAELQTLRAEYARKAQEIYTAVKKNISLIPTTSALSTISQPCFFATVKAVQNKTEFDFPSFQHAETSKETHRLQEERVAVSSWVRSYTYNQPSKMPLLHPPFPCLEGFCVPPISDMVRGVKLPLCHADDSAQSLLRSMVPLGIPSLSTAPALHITQTLQAVHQDVAAASFHGSLPSRTSPRPELVAAPQEAVQKSSPATSIPPASSDQSRVKGFSSTKIRYTGDTMNLRVESSDVRQRPPPL